MKSPRLWILFLILLLAITLPYLAGWLAGEQDLIFGGFLMNTLDGNSYLAKMRQGFDGSWAFHLPFTSETGEGSPLFIFYLLLGHLSRIAGISLVATFHAGRVMGAVYLWAQLYLFCRSAFIESSLPVLTHEPIRRDGLTKAGWYALLLAAAGSGLGWLFFATGVMTADFWVAEAYPFLSAYVNPHFPLGLGLLLNIFREYLRPAGLNAILKIGLLGVGLSIVYPFGIVLAVMITTLSAVIVFTREREIRWSLFGLVPGGLWLLYQYSLTITDPLLNIWNQQNINLTPPVGSILVSLSPALLLAGYAVYQMTRFRKAGNTEERIIQSRYQQLLILWLVSGLVLMYVPVIWQRRFMFATFVPTALLGAAGLILLQQRIHRVRVRQFVWPGVLVASLLTNALVITAGTLAAVSQDETLYITKSEMDAITWVEENTPEDAVLMAPVDFGQYIPGRAGRAVVYGHPYETVKSSEKQREVEKFYRGAYSIAEVERLLWMRGVDYVWWSTIPENRVTATPDQPYNSMELLERVYQNPEVSIYRVITETK